MAYYTHTGSKTEYQGESFTKTIYKDSGEAWGDNEAANYELVDTAGAQKSTGSLTKVESNLGLTFTVPDTDTAALTGNHKLLVHLTDTIITTFDDIIVDYDLDYVERKSTV